MPLFQEATERKILVEMLMESIKPAPNIITNPDEIPCKYLYSTEEDLFWILFDKANLQNFQENYRKLQGSYHARRI